MEEIKDVQSETQQVNVQLIYYLNDEEEKEGGRKFNIHL